MVRIPIDTGQVGRAMDEVPRSSPCSPPSQELQVGLTFGRESFFGICNGYKGHYRMVWGVERDAPDAVARTMIGEDPTASSLAWACVPDILFGALNRTAAVLLGVALPGVMQLSRFVSRWAPNRRMIGSARIGCAGRSVFHIPQQNHRARIGLAGRQVEAQIPRQVAHAVVFVKYIGG